MHDPLRHGSIFFGPLPKASAKVVSPKPKVGKKHVIGGSKRRRFSSFLCKIFLSICQVWIDSGKKFRLFHFFVLKSIFGSYLRRTFGPKMVQKPPFLRRLKSRFLQVIRHTRFWKRGSKRGLFSRFLARNRKSYWVNAQKGAKRGVFWPFLARIFRKYWKNPAFLAFLTFF